MHELGLLHELYTAACMPNEIPGLLGLSIQFDTLALSVRLLHQAINENQVGLFITVLFTLHRFPDPVGGDWLVGGSLVDIEYT